MVRDSEPSEVEELSPNVMIARVLEDLSRFVHEHRDRLWRGPEDRRRAQLGSEHWIGRIDPRSHVVALETEFVRGHLARFGDPMDVIQALTQRGVLKMSPSGAVRWQQRVGGRGRRISTFAFVAAALHFDPSRTAVTAASK